MAFFASLSAGLNLNIEKFVQNMKKATETTNKFAADLSGQINGGMIEPAKKAGSSFKDVGRIVQGILISKAFYSGLNAIRGATDAVWDFSTKLEYAQMVYSNLFGDPALASEFINVLKDFSAVTPFAFEDTEAAAKRLLAYGIQAKNVMFVMRGVLSAATVQGTDAVIEPISRALGQIYTKGRLMNEEMRQLAEAGIPVYDILQDKLGLTVDQLRNLGKTAVPASDAINALVEGINERFGSTLLDASMTTTGIISNIKDNALQLFSGIFTPLTATIKGAIADVGNFIAELRKIQDLKGLGGVFERLVPPELQGTIRAFIVNLKNLWDVLKVVVSSSFDVLKNSLVTIMEVFNAIAPILTGVLAILAGIVKAITSNSTAMRILTALVLAAASAWLIYKVQVLAAAVGTVVVKGLIAAAHGLVTALSFIVEHPVWTLLAVGVGIFMALTGSSEKFRNSINNLYSGFTKLGGMDPSKVLMPESKDRAADLGKFNEALDGTSASMEDLAGKTGAASKAAKGLLGFDEVFKLNEPDAGNNAGGALDGLADDLSGLGGLGMPEIELPVPDFSDFSTNFVDGLLDALGGKEKIVSAGIGALIGAAIGGILAGPLGAKIGALAGAIIGYFWPAVADALNLTDVGTVAMPIAVGLGAAIGAIAGGPLGAIVGAAIGLLVGWVVDSITRGFEDGDWSKVGLPVGIGLGAAIGMLVGGPAGALIGGGIGALVGSITDMLIKGFSTGEWDVSGLSQNIGIGIGAAIGFVLGGPAGATIGAAVGVLVGRLVGLISDNWSAITDWFAGVGNWFSETGAAIGGFFADMWNGALSSLSTWWSDTTTGFGIWWTTIKSGFDTWANDTLASVGSWWEGTKSGFNTWLTDTSVGLGTWWGATKTGFDTWATDTATGLGTWWTDTGSGFSTWWSDTGAGFSTWLSDTAGGMGTWWSDTKSGFSSWWGDTGTGFSEWRGTTGALIGDWRNLTGADLATWWADTKTGFGGWWSSTTSGFDTWKTTTKDKISSWWSETGSGFSTWRTDTASKLSGWWSDTRSGFSTWRTDTGASVTSWASSTKESVSSWASQTGSKLSGWWSDTETGFSTWWSNSLSGFSNWAKGIYDAVFGWFDKLGTKLSEFGDKLAFWKKDAKEGTDEIYGGGTSGGGGSRGSWPGHAVGGVFNREHIARFAEGNKSEAIIPLENNTAMQPFVQAVSDGLSATLMPILASMSGGQSQNNLRPLYVGTLVADSRSLKELNRKMQVIQLEEDARRGY